MVLMRLGDFDAWARSLLEFELTDGIDISLNGIQVGERRDEVSKMAFAVDACMDSFIRTKEEGAEALFVHHGLFWGAASALSGVMGGRVRYLMKNGLALYACHLPLDRHAEVGNNARIAKVLELAEIEPFGLYKGKKIGFKGLLPEAMGLETVIEKAFGTWTDRINALRFGPKEIRSVGILSGGGTRETSQAVAEGLDCYITGDSSHEVYHEAREAGINVVFAGHYLTEIFGVKAMAEKVASELPLETVFLDIPTGY